MFLAPEHSLFDRINLIRGLIRGVKHIYPQLADLDFERDITELECPLFIVNGRYDYSCVATITERWYTKVKAPLKGLLWLENSGHNAVYTEADMFMRYMVQIPMTSSLSRRSRIPHTDFRLPGDTSDRSFPGGSRSGCESFPSGFNHPGREREFST